MNKWLIFAIFFAFCGAARAGDDTNSTPTMVIGAAKNADGKIDVMVLQQPEDAPNPLGNPLLEPPPQIQQPTPPAPAKDSTDSTKASNADTIPYAITDDMPINPQFTPETTPQIEAKKIQSTIYEDDGRIYDIQSVPVQDISKVEEPNIQPTISTYPSY